MDESTDRDETDTLTQVSTYKGERLYGPGDLPASKSLVAQESGCDPVVNDLSGGNKEGKKQLLHDGE